jgi:hypothetical protein
MVMVDMFMASVSKVRRIDNMVIPLLKMKKNTLMQSPWAKANTSNR